DRFHASAELGQTLALDRGKHLAIAKLALASAGEESALFYPALFAELAEYREHLREFEPETARWGFGQERTVGPGIAGDEVAQGARARFEKCGGQSRGQCDPECALELAGVLGGGVARLPGD